MIVRYIEKKHILEDLRNGLIKIEDLFDTFELKFKNDSQRR